MAYRKYTNSELTRSLKSLYLDSETADVHFVFKPSNDRIPAHKILLIGASDVFRAMLNGCWSEKTNITIIDASMSAFREFLQFFYLIEVELSMENIIEVMNLGQKYAINGCKKACIRFLEYNLTNETVCMTYSLATLYELKELQKMCDIHFVINFSDVLKTSDFLECDEGVLNHISTLNTLCPESEKFHAFMAWLKKACKTDEITRDLIGTHIGGIFENFKFEEIERGKFHNIVEMYSDLFTTDERENIIFWNLTNQKFDLLPPLFRFQGEHFFVCQRLCGSACELDHIAGQPITSAFYSNTNLVLFGIVCAELFQFNGFSRQLTQNLDAKIQIIEIRGRQRNNEISDIIYTEENIKLLAGKDTLIRLMKPVIIRRGIKYKIQLDLDQNLPFTCCSVTKFKSDEAYSDHGIIIKFTNDVIKHEQKRGIIKGIRFKKSIVL